MLILIIQSIGTLPNRALRHLVCVFLLVYVCTHVRMAVQSTDEFQDDHTRAIILRGGSNYRPTGSLWYFSQAKQNNQNEKYFLNE